MTVQRTGERVEELLASLRSQGGAAADTAEELVRLLVGLYGDGLSHIVASLQAGGQAGRAMLDTLAADPVVEGLLLLHGLHPLDVDARIQRALDQVRPYLGSHAGGVQYLGVRDGVAHLRLEGTCHGCPSSTVTVRLAIEGAVQDAAPEVTEVVVEGMTAPPEPALLQIGPRPGAYRRPTGCGAPWRNRRRVGCAAGYRAAELPPGHRIGGWRGRARVLGPRDPVRVPGRVRIVRLRDGRGPAGSRGADLPVRSQV